MLFLIRATVHQQNLSNEELWTLWENEITIAKKAMESGKIISAYKVAGSKEVVLIYQADSHDELDRVFTAQLPLADYLTINEMTPIRPYLDFAEDVINRWGKKHNKNN
ncbi:methenyltetrahydrofolate cyclohydrolase /5,10-methylenetetrahydrofolate dehydrogenase (NADP+) [Psychrobacillus psychrotolerans]|uniref:Methenyltetrahydrofolate cyclohydrolase /5,10-methylenetetrahydrofolate dehydrogenase (NADP+) n=1 Tax=Psychrobacillus psychrotolerans TaxID=126156 RepID=A0A1I6AVX6_9BACI|nr:muconolactone Delta-isomerase family protein [Psychrobacillus psychrotolerans]SFQ72844.1 methenyltetrahydrofolate cyclohydrolase /5,10-methylenetetrahydrofolate dehydrogenase (NADP+) [Psychrobacillus psychrotolerans]